MDVVIIIIEVFFSLALFINALLFIPQAVRIFREKSAKDVSLLTFGGFLLIQLFVVLHGVITHDYLLVLGYLFSMLMCGSVVFLIFLYRNNDKKSEIEAREKAAVEGDKPSYESLQAKLNEIEKSDQAKSDILRSIEHDIRAPFANVYSLIEILAEQEQDPAKRAMFKDIAACEKELMHYCDMILDCAQVNGAIFPISNMDFCLTDVVDEISAVQNFLAQSKRLQFNDHIESDLPTILRGDPYRLKRILMNLVNNAIKFTDSGSVSLEIKLSQQAAKKGTLQIDFIVTDTGIGIPEDQQSLIFEKFTRLNKQTGRHVKGQGLGLNIVKQFVVDMKGSIQLQSQEGQGSTFIVTLPFPQNN